jgi:hypothetical protein
MLDVLVLRENVDVGQDSTKVSSYHSWPIEKTSCAWEPDSGISTRSASVQCAGGVDLLHLCDSNIWPWSVATSALRETYRKTPF